MGASQSGLKLGERRSGSPQQQFPDRADAQVRHRIQLLEELCAQVEPGRRAELLQQLAGGQPRSGEEFEAGNFLAAKPPEFNPGRLIAAGSYGRVYEGTYGDQPAALKLLILDEDTAHAILNEVRLCLKLSHKNLVQLLDCAVVATKKQPTTPGCQAPSSPGAAFAGHHHILPVFGAGSSPATPSTSCPYSYLPVVTRQAPLSSLQLPALGQHAGSSAAAWRGAAAPAATELTCQDTRLPAITSLGHACFEVWIAMELCDGGTLTEQLQRGFHCLPGSQQVDMEQLLQVGLDITRALAYMHRENVCHGDLKTENVLLKTLSAASAAELQHVCSSCGSSCCHEDCTWLTMLCSSSVTSNTCGSRCRSCSGDSCLSCCSRPAGCGDPHNGSSSPDSLSTSSSNASGPNIERRSRSGGFKGSHLLSGLCCMGSPMSCATEDDVLDSEPRLSGCFACGCAVMTLEPSSRHSRYEPAALPAATPVQQSGTQPASEAVSLGPSCVVDVMDLPLSLDAAGHLSAPADSCTSGFAAPTPFYSMLPPFSVPPAAIAQGQDHLQYPQPVEPQALTVHLQDSLDLQHGSPVLEDVPEEEHVAPLSLYTQARQRRRSRLLPSSVVLPAAFAAVAASSSDVHAGVASTGSSCGSSTSSSEDEALGHSKRHAHRSSLLKQQGFPRPGALDAADTTAAAQMDAPAAPVAALPPVSASSSSSRLDAAAGHPSWHQAAALPGQPTAAGPGHDVYAHSMMRPPMPRARRHSYCYGTAASYGTPVLSFGSTAGQGLGRTQSNPTGGISATEAATAIAAAAEAVRLDGTRAAGTEHRSHRNRRMSWDDRMLCQQSPMRAGLSGFIGAALPGLSRLGVDTSTAGHPDSRRTRRHSWACYLQPDASATAARALSWSLPIPASLAAVQQQQQQREQAYGGQLPAGSLDSLGGPPFLPAGSDTLGPIPSSSRTSGRKARRHSWAAYGQEQGQGLPLGPGRLSGLRALSSCFAVDGSVHQHVAAVPTSIQGSPQRHLFSLPQFPSCCGEGCLQPLDDVAYDEDSSRRGLLAGATSSNVLVAPSSPGCLLLPGGEGDDAAAVAGVGCFGKWSSSCNSSSVTSSVGSGPSRCRRRYSWCCGAGSEAELWAVFNMEDSCSQLGLLAGAAPLSVPLLNAVQDQQRRPRRDRRSSFDSYSYRRKLNLNRGRKAQSLDAPVNTPGSWQLSSPSSPSVSQQASLPRSCSDAAGRTEQLPPAALLAAAHSSGQPGSLPPTAPLARGSVERSSSGLQGAAAGAIQLLSLSPSCSNSSPAAAKDCNTPVAPIRTAQPHSPAPAPADTMPAVQVDQSLSGPCAPLGLQLPGTRTSRVRVSLDQPLLPSLLPAVPQQQQQQAEGLLFTEHAAAGASSSAATAAVQGSQGAASAAPWQDLHQKQQQPLSSPQPVSAAELPAFAVSSSQGGGASGRQVLVQHLLSLVEPVPSQLAASAGGVAEASACTAPTAAEDASAAEPFTGSFTLHPLASRASGKAPGAAGRGRRWSTGVAAHQLLLRKQLLDAYGNDGLPTMGQPADAPVAPGGAAPQPDAVLAAAGLAEGSSAFAGGAAPQGTWSVPVAHDPAGTSGPVPMLPRSGSGSSSGRSSNPMRQTTSTSVSVAINVLGMPPCRPSVMSQRRMSYDTATGVYQVVAQLSDQDIERLSLDPMHSPGMPQPEVLLQTDSGSGSQQQAAQHVQHGLMPQPTRVPNAHWSVPGAGVSVDVQDLQQRPGACSSPGASPDTPSADCSSAHDEQMQQHCQAQMQRLLEALAKKGYGSLDHSDPAAGSSSQHQAAAEQPAPQATASLQHREQVACDVAPLPQRRYCAKVCDFGFSKCLRAGQSHCSTASAGTITHQAPEVLRHGHLSPAADIYAFGIIMWELLTRDRPFRGLLEGDLVVGVCDKGLRPVFPPGCPSSYVALAQQCWSDDPAHRPTGVQLVKRLNELLYEERRARLRASAGMAPAACTANETCRRRRHSMPVPGNVRQRRRSRRMSLFLLPFTRQPVVPEDAPLDQPLDDWRCTVSGNDSCQAHAGSALGQGRNSSDQAVSSSAAGGSPVGQRGRGSSSSHGLVSGFGSGSFSGAHASSGAHATSGPTSSNSNAAASAGGLLVSSSTLLSRLKGGGVGGAAAPAGSLQSASAGQDVSGDTTAFGDGTEWFQSL